MIFAVLLSLSYAFNQGSQAPIEIENFDDPICDKHSECHLCDFEELRTFDVCTSSGYYQTIYCTMKSLVSDSTQDISYIASCFPSKAPILTSFY